MNGRRAILTLLFSVLAVIVVSVTVYTVPALPSWGIGWKSWGKDLTNSKFSRREHKISVANVSDLVEKWVFNLSNHNNCRTLTNPDGLADCSISATPTVSRNTLYVPDWAGNLYAINAKTGDLVWKTRIEDYTGRKDIGQISRTSPSILGNTLFIGTRGGAPAPAAILAVNKNDGSLKWTTDIDNHPAAMITAAPVAFRNKVYAGVSSKEEIFAESSEYNCCSFRGKLVALNAQTGALLWEQFMVPPPPAGTAATDWFSGNAVWGSSFSIDASRNSIYIATGNNYKVPDDLQACITEAEGIVGLEVKAEAVGQCLEMFDHPENYLDAILSLDLDTGAVNWARKLQGFDVWTVACIIFPFSGANCPDPAGPDFDFGQAPMLWTVKIDGKKRDLVGAGQKSGIVWALDRDTGDIVWSSDVAPGSHLGGSQWGSATDGERVYTSNTIAQDGSTHPGFWRALDAATGATVWTTNGPVSPFQTGPPSDRRNEGRVMAGMSVANGVVFGASLSETDENLFAMNAETGEILWSFAAGGSVIAFPSIVNGSLYWGTGYVSFLETTPNDKLYAFSVRGLEETAFFRGKLLQLFKRLRNVIRGN